MCAKVTKKKKNRKTGLIIAIVLLIVIFLLAWVLRNVGKTSADRIEESFTEEAIMETMASDPEAKTEYAREKPAEIEESFSEEAVTESTDPVVKVETERMECSLGKGLTLLEVGKYTGIYMEDGTDEIVSDVLMLIIRNDGEQDIQYAEFTVPTSGGDAKFTLSTLPAGEKIVLLEQKRMLWSAGEDYSNVKAEKVAVFSEPMNLCEDQLEFQILDGVINITNISDKDITGDIVIYYKNAAVDLLYGGITYRIRLEGGLKADEIRQIMGNHFAKSGSRIMFATIG